ncbi:MAG TPA: helicase-related protein [Candidatus Binatia bacterium]|nr:helicase-related protein [Candidatus Binatia bacterium]
MGTCLKELERLVCEHPQGDALIFMPGTYEITRTVQAARDRLGPKFLVFPLHGELPPIDQDAAVARYDRRKIVVATNVAETSLTIDGVRLVIDSGLARLPRYDPYRGINTLLVEKISRAAADQRAGRAGRTAPGHCLRLWTTHDQNARPAQELSEVKRLDLSEVILTLKASGVNDVQTFRWLEAPDPRALERAEMLLTDLGAIDDTTSALTGLGRRMLAFPAHPRYARMLLAAHDYGCVRPVALIAALTQGRELLVRRQAKEVEDGRDDLFDAATESDLFVLMRARRDAERNGYDIERCRRLGIHAQAARQIGPLFEQFLRIAAAEGLDISEKPAGHAAVARCVLVWVSRPSRQASGRQHATVRTSPRPSRRVGPRERRESASLRGLRSARGGKRRRQGTSLECRVESGDGDQGGVVARTFPRQLQRSSCRCLRPDIEARRCPRGKAIPRPRSRRETFRQSAG